MLAPKPDPSDRPVPDLAQSVIRTRDPFIEELPGLMARSFDLSEATKEFLKERLKAGGVPAFFAALDNLAVSASASPQVHLELERLREHLNALTPDSAGQYLRPRMDSLYRSDIPMSGGRDQGMLGSK